MPELPELEIVKEVLQRRVVGQAIDEVRIDPKGGSIIIRDLMQRGFEQTLLKSTIKDVTRRGKFLVFSIDPPVYLVLNPKLTGRLQLAAVNEKRMPKTHIVFKLSGGAELRYIDQKTMGQLYLTHNLDQVNDYPTLGPEPFDISLAEFRERLRPYRGEIKGVLIRSEFIAGIGNAYADEILWAAKIHPYRKRTQLSAEEIDRLYGAIQSVLHESIDKVRIEMGESIHLKPRDFMAVHMKTDQPCPRCGHPISLVGANERITNFCRNCQPGGLIKGM